MKNIFQHLPFRYAAISFVSHLLFIFIVEIVGSRPVPFLAPDSITYKMDAQNLLQQGVFSRENAPPYLWEPYRTPGYPLLIAFSEKLIGSDCLIPFITAVIAGAASWAAVQLTMMLNAGKLGQHVSGWVTALLPNSLGLSTFLLTDAIFGYLFLIWVYLLFTGFSRNQKTSLVISAVMLFALQSIKPTANAGILFVIGIAVLFVHNRRQWLQVVLLVICAIVMPFSFAVMNYRDNGIFSPSLLGIQTVREYLMVRHLAEESGQSITETTGQIRLHDMTAAQQLSEPKSFYGRLYKIEQERVHSFLQSRPLVAVKLMIVEMVKQFLAPQEFASLAFMEEVPILLRTLGSLLSIILWIGACLGAVKSARCETVMLLLGTLAFFLVTGSVSHYVGARLRFPADLLAIPFFALGISDLILPGLKRVSLKQ